MSDCPFEVGQSVVFEPDDRTYGHQVMVENLTRGEAYRISQIVRGAYLRLEGHETAGGGLHWSAFIAA